MKAFGLVQENLKKELIGKKDKKLKPLVTKKKEIQEKPIKREGPDYAKLTKKNSEIIKKQKALLNKIKSKEVSEDHDTDISEDTGPSILDELDSEESEITDNTSDSINTRKKTTDGPIELKIKEWSLKGSNKNVLMVSMDIINHSPVKEEKEIKIVCSTFDENGDFAGTKKLLVNVNLNPGQKMSLNSQIFGIVNTDSKTINCIIEKEKVEEIKENSSETEEMEDEDIINALTN